MMTREELLIHCKYYKGEEESPYEEQNASMLWFYERCWVTYILNSSLAMLEEYVVEYKNYGLESFGSGDNTLLSLKALLFNRYNKGSYSVSVEEFKDFYLKYYGDNS